MASRTVQPEPQPAASNRSRAGDTNLAAGDDLTVLGWGVILMLLLPDVGLAAALLRVLW